MSYGVCSEGNIIEGINRRSVVMLTWRREQVKKTADIPAVSGCLGRDSRKKNGVKEDATLYGRSRRGE